MAAVLGLPHTPRGVRALSLDLGSTLCSCAKVSGMRCFCTLLPPDSQMPGKPSTALHLHLKAMVKGHPQCPLLTLWGALRRNCGAVELLTPQ